MGLRKRKAVKEVKNDKSYNFEMEILDEGELDKFLIVPENTLDKKTLEDNV